MRTRRAAPNDALFKEWSIRPKNGATFKSNALAVELNVNTRRVGKLVVEGLAVAEAAAEERGQAGTLMSSGISSGSSPHSCG